MQSQKTKRVFGWFVFLAFATLMHGISPFASHAYSPDDPVVQEMIDRGVAYLESQKMTMPNPGSFDDYSGVPILAAYAHYKCRHDPDNPVVKRGVQAALAMQKALENGAGEHGHKRNYEIPVATLLLAEVDAARYKPQLESFQHHLMDHQMPGGGFGYPGYATGDISQVQYVVLAIWTLDRNGIPLDYGKVAACAEWLMRVQDIRGAWPYQAYDPGPGKGLVAQRERVGMSMGLAGGSSLLIAGDALRLWGDTVDEADPGVPGLPKAIQLYKEDANKKRRGKVKLSQEPVKRSASFFDQWRVANPYTRPKSSDFYYYIIYTRERYESFVEIAYGRPKDKSPDWYNEIAAELKSFQGASGGWDDRAHTSPIVSTSFALLFLIRSTQKAIFQSSQGSLTGGYGFPEDTTNIRVDGSQIKGQAIATQVTDLLSILEEDENADSLGDKSLPDDLDLDPNPKARRAQIDRLERLVRGSRSYQARRVAAKLLGKSDELRVAPALIYALSDPDRVVQSFARDGLRFISRKFDGYDLPPSPPPSADDAVKDRWKQEVSKVQDKWRDWYRTVDPTHVFLDYDL
ncbi:HEAT repeat domain-containing protein [Rubripirellula amarantea]|nr:HEAT repeat domain-containing protein [Rubripirellula amarantea]